MTDKLSGLKERKPFLLEFDQETKRAVRYKRAITALMIDIDHNHFSKERDVRWSLGYSLIKQVAAVLKQGLRDIDVLSRYEGEIFAALLPETDRTGAAFAAERIRKLVEEHLFMGAQVGDKLRIAVNIGYASYPGHADTSDDLLELARVAMDKARTNGGNQSCEAEVPTKAAASTGEETKTE
jgi:diguanylate cyclase (GGDEF)-like protein